MNQVWEAAGELSPSKRVVLTYKSARGNNGVKKKIGVPKRVRASRDGGLEIKAQFDGKHPWKISSDGDIHTQNHFLNPTIVGFVKDIDVMPIDQAEI